MNISVGSISNNCGGIEESHENILYIIENQNNVLQKTEKLYWFALLQGTATAIKKITKTISIGS